jgi:hypothetical protein
MSNEFVTVVIINGLLSVIISLVMYVAVMKLDRWLDAEAELKRKQKYYDEQTGVFKYEEID